MINKEIEVDLILSYYDDILTFIFDDKVTGDRYIFFKFVEDVDYVGIIINAEQYDNYVNGKVDLLTLFISKDRYYHCREDNNRYFIYNVTNVIDEDLLPNENDYLNINRSEN